MNVTAPIDVSIIIVNWNSAHYLYPCLASVYRECAGLNCEVIVVDNASFDGSDEIVAAAFPQAHFIQSPENLGFTRANNLAYRHSSGRTLLFLDPDAELTEGSLRHMYESLIADDQVGVVGARLLNSDYSVQARSIQHFPTIWRQALESETLRRRYPASPVWGTRPLYEVRQGSVPVDVVSGACLFIKRFVFEQVGGFSEEYFLYCDDVDLCHKVRAAGYTVHHVSESEVIHHGGISLEAAAAGRFSEVMMRAALHTFFKRTRGSLYAATYLLVTSVLALLRLAVITAVMPVSYLLRRAQESRRLFRKWLDVLRWALNLGSAPGVVWPLSPQPAELPNQIYDHK